MKLLGAIALTAILGFGQVYEITSPLGTKRYSLPDEKLVVVAAQRELAAHANSAQAFVKLSQAHAAVWEEREAVSACSRGLLAVGENADLLTERGHRELPLRDFERARKDLSKAVQLSPKRMDAYYHLGLANYFLGDFNDAAEAFRHAVEFAPDDDERINSTNWLYASLRRAGRAKDAEAAAAAIGPEMTNSAPHTLHYLNLVRLFQGRMAEADVLPPQPPRGSTDTEAELGFDTVGYGVGNWHLYNGEAGKAREYFSKVAEGRVWITWGFIGSENELAGK